MFCECCNVTCYSQAELDSHVKTMSHDFNEERIEREQQIAKTDRQAKIINARLTAMLHGKMPNEAMFDESDDDSDEYDSDDLDDDVYDYASEFAYYNMNNTYDDDFADGDTDF